MKPRHAIAASLGLMLLNAVLSPRLKDPPPSTPETDAMKLIASSVTQFEKTHERTPRDWQELTAGAEHPFTVDFITPQSKPSLRYQLFSPPLELENSTHQKLEVVAVTRKPMREPLRRSYGFFTRTTDPGRYLIFKGDSPKFQAGWFPETAINAMWSAAGQQLPAPDQEPARSWWRAQQWGRNWGAHAYLAAVIVGLWMLRRWGGRLADRMVPEV